MIKKVKLFAPWLYVIKDRNGGELVEIFYEKYLRETNQTEFINEKERNKKM